MEIGYPFIYNILSVFAVSKLKFVSISQSVRLVILFLVWETRGGAEQSAEGGRYNRESGFFLEEPQSLKTGRKNSE